MKRTASVVYTVLVIVVLLGVIGYFGWKTYDARAARMSDFAIQTEKYAERLAESLVDKRDVDAEVAIAEELMKRNPSLIAVQVFSHDDGLRLSVVKPPAGDFSSKPVGNSEYFDGLVQRIRFQVISHSMRVDQMPGLEASFVGVTLTGGEIRNNVLIILVTVAGLFVITLAMIFIRPAAKVSGDGEFVGDDAEDFSLPSDLDSDLGDDPDSELSDEDFSLPDFDDADRLDENDLFGSKPEVGDSLPLDDEFELPDLDDFPESGTQSGSTGDFLDRLGLELDRAASFNQDLTVLIFTTGASGDAGIRGAYGFEDLVFSVSDDLVGVIEINKDLDQSLAGAEDVVRSFIERSGNRSTRVGIASRNGRLISAERLFNEAENALRKTDSKKNIVAFRSDPEKYREYLKDQNP